MAASGWIFLVPIFFALLQSWAVHRVGVQLDAASLADERSYIAQARLLQDEPISLLRILEFGVYPVFLSLFDLEFPDWSSTASTDPKLLVVYAAESLILSVASALYLCCAFIFIPGNLIKRIIISVLLGGILLSPLVIVWPNSVLTEAIMPPAILLFACACLADDFRGRWSPILVSLVCCLLVLVRDPMFLFVLPFAVLLLANNLFAKTNWTYPIMIGTVLMLIAIGLGTTKVSLLPVDPLIAIERHLVDRGQSLVNIIQFRILPDAEHRNFFVERGLPISSTVMERSGKPAWGDNDWYAPDSELSERPEFIAYRHWVVTKGAQTYLKFLLTHPGYLVRAFVDSPNVAGEFGGDFDFSVTDLLSIPYSGYGTSLTPYPQWLRGFLLVPFGWLIPSLYLILAAIHYVWQTATRQRASRLDIAAIAAGVAAFATYHADAWDPWRHTVPFIVLIYISLITRTADIAVEIVRRVRLAVALPIQRANNDRHRELTRVIATTFRRSRLGFDSVAAQPHPRQDRQPAPQ